MKLLLDTHIWIWSQAIPEKLSARTRRVLADPKNELWLSPISLWELVLLVEKGRLVLESGVSEWAAKAAAPFKEAPLTAEIVLEVARLRLPHGDPADRFLAATARSLGLTLLTADARLVASKEVPTFANS